MRKEGLQFVNVLLLNIQSDLEENSSLDVDTPEYDDLGITSAVNPTIKKPTRLDAVLTLSDELVEATEESPLSVDATADPSALAD